MTTPDDEYFRRCVYCHPDSDREHDWLEVNEKSFFICRLCHVTLSAS